ncbi:hypothetical protein [Methylobacterium tarhaniae]
MPLRLDEASRLAHPALEAPGHPGVIPAKEDRPYALAPGLTSSDGMRSSR